MEERHIYGCKDWIQRLCHGMDDPLWFFHLEFPQFCLSNLTWSFECSRNMGNIYTKCSRMLLQNWPFEWPINMWGDNTDGDCTNGVETYLRAARRPLPVTISFSQTFRMYSASWSSATAPTTPDSSSPSDSS